MVVGEEVVPGHSPHLPTVVCPSTGNLSDERKKKNLWCRKCVRRAIFRIVEVRVEGGLARTFDDLVEKKCLTLKINITFQSQIRY